MVKETRLVFEPGDILNVRVTCDKCKGQMVYPLVEGFPVPDTCPHCQTPFVLSAGIGRAVIHHTAALLTAIKFFAANKNESPVVIQLEIHDE